MLATLLSAQLLGAAPADPERFSPHLEHIGREAEDKRDRLGVMIVATPTPRVESYTQLHDRRARLDIHIDDTLALAEYVHAQGDDVAIELFEPLTRVDEALVRAYAHYRLAWIELAPRDGAASRPDSSLTHFVAANEGASKIESAAGEALAIATRRDLVLAYARVGEPAHASAWFRALAGSPDESEIDAMLSILARTYAELGAPAASNLIYTELFTHAQPNADALCPWSSTMARNSLALGHDDDALAQAWVLADHARTIADSSRRNALRCFNLTRRTFQALAFTWHARAVKDGDPRDFERAITAYEAHLNLFP